MQGSGFIEKWKCAIFKGDARRSNFSQNCQLVPLGWMTIRNLHSIWQNNEILISMRIKFQEVSAINAIASIKHLFWPRVAWRISKGKIVTQIGSIFRRMFTMERKWWIITVYRRLPAKRVKYSNDGTW